MAGEGPFVPSGTLAASCSQVADFVERYMPAYRLYLPDLYARGPTTAREGHTLVVRVDAQRRPTGALPSLPPA